MERVEARSPHRILQQKARGHGLLQSAQNARPRAWARRDRIWRPPRPVFHRHGALERKMNDFIEYQARDAMQRSCSSNAQHLREKKLEFYARPSLCPCAAISLRVRPQAPPFGRTPTSTTAWTSMPPTAPRFHAPARTCHRSGVSARIRLGRVRRARSASAPSTAPHVGRVTPADPARPAPRLFLKFRPQHPDPSALEVQANSEPVTPLRFMLELTLRPWHYALPG
jgi:hypothetical protein